MKQEKTRILITGGSGFLGSRLALYLKDRHELLVPTHGDLNVSREEAVRTYLEETRPAIVIHCAALSDTGYCEQHPEESHRVNVQGSVRVAKACKLTGAKLVFMSSDQVYNGTPWSGPLKEEDVLQPVNIYGQHKLEAEQRVLRNMPEAVGLRLTWMYDLPTNGMKQNSSLLARLQQAADAGTTLRAATHEYRGVTYVWDVVRNLEKAFALSGGIYNFGSSNPLDSHNLHLQAAHLMKLKNPTDWILRDEERFSDQARNLTMDCARIGEHGIHFKDSVTGIAEALQRPFRTA